VSFTVADMGQHVVKVLLRLRYTTKLSWFKKL